MVRESLRFCRNCTYTSSRSPPTIYSLRSNSLLEIDCGTLQWNRTATESYRSSTITFLTYALERRTPTPPQFISNHNSGCFDAIGLALQTGQSQGALRRYANDMYSYVHSVCSHQESREMGFSTLEDYYTLRVLTIGAYPCLTMMEWAYGLDILEEVYEHEAIKVIFREVAVSSFLTNDIFSIRKEIAQGDLDSVVPIMIYHYRYSPQAAVDFAVKELQRSFDEFVAAEERILNALPNIWDGSRTKEKLMKTGSRSGKEERPRQLMGEIYEKLVEDTKMLVQGCKDVMIGGLCWAAETERYLPRSCFVEGGKIRMKL